jgi:ABC-2 type transport system ATP-binding protein
MPAITVSQLSKSFGRVRAVDGLDFTADFGRVTGFLGPNGAGKTTTLRILLGLVRADQGTAEIEGKSYLQLSDPLRQVGAVLEAAAFHPGRTAKVHLLSLCAAAGLPPGRAGETLEETGLSAAADRRVGGFSLGMRQRLAIATALLGDPRVLILDEPSNGLDPAGMHWLRSLLRSMASQGRAVLVSSHVLTEIDLIADDVVIVNDGRLVKQGTKAEVTQGSTLEEAFLALTMAGAR